MSFDSLEFVVFLPVVLCVYYALSHRAQNLWLVAASYLFYGWWDYRFLTLLAISTIVDFYCGRGIDATTDERRKRILLTASVCTNLGILGTFKYFNFFMDSAVACLNALGLGAAGPALQIVLPVGISFYTFQTMSYTIDIYRGKLKPTHNFLTFALYVSYFPQLVAGPIERATTLLPQLQSRRQVSMEEIRGGSYLILIGLFKKVGVANAIAPLVDAVYTHPEAADGLSLLIATYLFSIQIYCDFSGYSNIARGTSRLLGIHLMVNFRQPYFSQSITEFWRRWHISLSSWLRDYLYIPLGGNRISQLATYRNLMLTMLLGGLWHGANWTFIVWGGMHGLYLAVHKMWVERGGKKNENRHQAKGRYDMSSIAISVIKVFCTFHLVTLTWVFFRSDSFTKAAELIRGICRWQSGKEFIGQWDILRAGVLVLTMLSIDTVESIAEKRDKRSDRSPVVRGLAYGVLGVVLLALGGISNEVPFIYFQF